MIRELDPGKWITTNFQSVMAQHTDYRDMARDLDINGMNHYPKRSPELILDYYRQGARPLVVLEQFTRLLEYPDARLKHDAEAQIKRARE